MDKVALLTLIFADDVRLLKLAVKVASPIWLLVTRPLSKLLTAKILSSLEDQLTSCVISCVLPFDKIPIAIKCEEVPSANVSWLGRMEISVTIASVTSMLVLTAIPLSVALISVLPVAMVDKVPALVLLEIDATVVWLEVQVT